MTKLHLELIILMTNCVVYIQEEDRKLIFGFKKKKEKSWRERGITSIKKWVRKWHHRTGTARVKSLL